MTLRKFLLKVTHLTIGRAITQVQLSWFSALVVPSLFYPWSCPHVLPRFRTHTALWARLEKIWRWLGQSMLLSKQSHSKTIQLPVKELKKKQNFISWTTAPTCIVTHWRSPSYTWKLGANWFFEANEEFGGDELYALWWQVAVTEGCKCHSGDVLMRALHAQHERQLLSSPWHRLFLAGELQMGLEGVQWKVHQESQMERKQDLPSGPAMYSRRSACPSAGPFSWRTWGGGGMVRGRGDDSTAKWGRGGSIRTRGCFHCWRWSPDGGAEPSLDKTWPGDSQRWLRSILQMMMLSASPKECCSSLPGAGKRTCHLLYLRGPTPQRGHRKVRWRWDLQVFRGENRVWA